MSEPHFRHSGELKVRFRAILKNPVRISSPLSCFMINFHSLSYTNFIEEVVEEVRFDPCHLNDCGEGRCVANGDSYRCRCPRGFQETFNSDRKASCQGLLLLQ